VRRMSLRLGRLRLGVAVPALLWTATTSPVHAQQYVTDDPEIVDPGHFEVIAFASRTKEADGASGTAGLDLAVGIARNLELSAVLPIDHEGEGWGRGQVGDIEVGITWLVAHQREGSLIPDVAFAPSILLPTGAMPIRPGRAGLFLPVWLRKDVGAWVWTGGGGYSLNGGAGRRDSWLAALRVTRDLGDRLGIGAEIYCETADSDDGQTATGLAAAATYQLSPTYSVEMSAGPRWQGGVRGSRIYVGLAAGF
jgi:hypothetical protein